MSLNLKIFETPYQAFIRKIPREEAISSTRNQGEMTCPEELERGISFREKHRRYT